jgi:hypothetical protein
MTINLTKIHTDAKGLTQQAAMNRPGASAPLSTHGQFKTTVFTRTMQASRTGEILVPIGTGQVDPVNHCRVLLQLSVDEQIPVEELVDVYKTTFYQMAFQPEIIRKNVANILGSSERAISRNNIPRVPPSVVMDNLMRALHGGNVTRVDEVITHLVADGLISIYAQIGLITADAPHVHRMRPGNLYPSYSDLLDVMALRDVMYMATRIESADISIIKRSIDTSTGDGAGRAVSPSLLAQHIQNAFVGAYDTSKGSYASSDIVSSVLTVLHRMWSPMTPDVTMPSERVQNSSFIGEFQSNLALFLATQDMVANHPARAVVSFSDEELTSTIFPLLQETLTTISPYNIRALSDSVAFYGMTASRDHNGEPGHMFLYEDWRVQDHVDAFVPVRQTPTSTGRFLVDQPTVSGALAHALAPVQKVVSIADTVNSRIDSYNLTEVTKRAKDHTIIHLAFPSLEVREAQLEVDTLDALIPYVIEGKEATKGQLDKLGLTERQLKSLRYDYYASIMHLGVARSNQVTVGELMHSMASGTNDATNAAATVGVHSPLYIRWVERVQFTKQRGLSALLNGEVQTTEPLEVLAYQRDFAPADTLSVNYPKLSDYEGAVHLWNWPKYSVKLATSAPFEITLHNKSYRVSVDEHEMLALGARRNELRFMNQYDTKALVRIWLKHIFDDHKFVAAQAKSAKDDLVKEAYRGREIQSALMLVAMLSSIASNSTGQRAITYVKQRVADAMYGNTGTLDGYDEIHVGVQSHRLRVWAGIRTLELLQLISPTEASELAKQIKETNALAYALSTVDLNSLR